MKGKNRENTYVLPDVMANIADLGLISTQAYITLIREPPMDRVVVPNFVLAGDNVIHVDHPHVNTRPAKVFSNSSHLQQDNPNAESNHT
jgi:hypothetical protein